MRKYILCAMVFAIVATVNENTSAISSFTYPWIMKTGDTVTTAKWKGNNDTVKAFCDRVADTLNRAVARFSPSSLTHDSVMKYLRLDTIRSEPDVDSLKGLKRIKGKPIMDTIVVDSIATRTLKSSGTMLVDSIVSTKMINGNLKGNVTGTVSSATLADSSIGTNHLNNGYIANASYVHSLGDIYTSTTNTTVSTSSGWINSTPVIDNSVYVKRIGKLVIAKVTLSDSSNSTSCSFQLPDTAHETYSFYSPVVVSDSGVAQAIPGCAITTPNSRTVVVTKDWTTTTGLWKTSGIKSVTGVIIYEKK